MNFEDVEKLINLMQRYDLSELQVKEEGWEFSARRGEKPQTYMMAPPMMQAGQFAPGQSGMQAAVAPSGPPAKKQIEITSPLVGTFYRAPGPDQSNFKQEGDHLGADDVYCIIEAMKVMNEIKAGQRSELKPGANATIKKFLVENASSVEFGQPLLLVEID